MWNQKDAMDAGRFILPQAGWDDKSALGRYNNSHNPDFRLGGPYPGRGYAESGFTAENGYNRGGFHRDVILDRDRYQMASPAGGAWPPPRRADYDDELGVIRGSQRHAKGGYGDSYRESNNYRDADFREAADDYKDWEMESFREIDNLNDREFERGGKSFESERRAVERDEYGYKRSSVKGSKEGSWDKDYTHARYDGEYDSDHEKDRRDRSWQKSQKKERERERRRSKERDESPERGRRRERSHSHSSEHRSRRSRSSSRGYAREKRDRSYEDIPYDSYNDRKRSKDEKHHREYSVSASATLVVKGLSQRTVEDEIYKALADWGPLRHVRVIKERNTGISRGFAFIDFPSVESARKMMADVGDSGLVVDGRRLFFEYSSKPTGGSHGDSSFGSSAVDWMCIVCGCVNFARRTSCFQCNEPRTDDSPPADVSSVISSSSGRKGPEAGPTHVLVVRGLSENINEEILHYEFSKHAPIKDLRLVRDKFTHISKGFAFVHFHSVEDAAKALEASNGTVIDKNGQPLRVAYAKSVYGPNSLNTHTNHSQAAAAAIEAAAFSQQYDAAGWAPKEYNPEQGQDDGTIGDAVDNANAAPQAGFVWDEASGYYYDAASGFYYDGHSGLYYDGNYGIWYTFNQESQQYEPVVAQDGESAAASSSQTVNQQKVSVTANATVKTKDATTVRKAVISAPPSTIHMDQESIKGAAASKKEKGLKNLLPSSKTKISGVSSMWKQKQECSQATMDPSPGVRRTSLPDDKSKSNIVQSTIGAPASVTSGATIPKKIQGVIHTKQTLNKSLPEELPVGASSKNNDVATVPKKLEGVIHSKDGPVLTVLRVGNSLGEDLKSSDTSSLRATNAAQSVAGITALDKSDAPSGGQVAGGRRRFTEAPQSGYRDRAAERRNLYGTS